MAFPLLLRRIREFAITAVALVAGVCAAVAQPGPIAWSKIPVFPENESMLDVASVGDSAVVAVGTIGLVRYSTDLGRTWRLLERKWEGDNLTVTSTSSGEALVATSRGMLYRSRPPFARWDSMRAPDGMIFRKMRRSSTSRLVACDSASRIAQSGNDGVTWRIDDVPDGATIADVAITLDGLIVVLTKTARAYSLDRGADGWKPLSALPAFRRVPRHVMAQRRDRLYVVGEAGELVRSSDSGATWQTASLPAGLEPRMIADAVVAGFFTVDSGFVGLFAYLPEGPRGVSIRTTDAGMTWTRLPRKFNDSDTVTDIIGARAFVPVNDSVAFAAGGHTILSTSNAALSWRDRSFDAISGLTAFAAGGPATMFASNLAPRFDSATRDWPTRVILHSRIGETAWWRQTAVPQIGDGEISGIAATPSGKAMAVGSYGMCYLTLDTGKTWRRVGPPTSVRLIDVDFGPRQEIVIGGSEGRVFISRDTGVTWTDVQLTPQMYHTAVLWVDALTILTTGVCADSPPGTRIYRSTDGGGSWSWTSVASGSGRFARSADGRTLWFIGGSYEPGENPWTGAAMRSTDNGASWSALEFGGNALDDRFVTMNHVGDVIDLFDEHGRQLRSTDNGTSWRRYAAPIPSTTILGTRSIGDSAAVVAYVDGRVLLAKTGDRSSAAGRDDGLAGTASGLRFRVDGTTASLGWGASKRPERIWIIDATGRTVKKIQWDEHSSATSTTIDLTDLASGPYFLVAQSAQAESRCWPFLRAR